MFFNAAMALVQVGGSDELFKETYSTAQRIRAALPTEQMRSIFESAEPVQILIKTKGTKSLDRNHEFI
ncbi:MAG: hypothetical protein ACLQJ7_18035 [Syntrophobacteraceae bacterium]